MSAVIRWIISGSLLACGVALLSGGCKDKATPTAAALEAPPTGGVCAANYPLAYFAETLLGGALPVYFDAPADEDPAFWQPDDEALIRFQAAKVILMNGADYSKWAGQVSLPQSRVVDTSAGFAHALIQVKEEITHSHGPEGSHSHTGTAFTTWIDFDQAAKQLEAMCAALLPLLPEEAQSAVAQRNEELKEKLLALDERMLAARKKLAGRALLGSHPVYQYLARRYELDLQEVHWEPDVAPSKEALEELRGILKDHPATVMLWEGVPLKQSVAALKKLGVDSVVFNPCGNRPEQGDFLSVMDSNVAALESLEN